MFAVDIALLADLRGVTQRVCGTVGGNGATGMATTMLVLAVGLFGGAANWARAQTLPTVYRITAPTVRTPPIVGRLFWAGVLNDCYTAVNQHAIGSYICHTAFCGIAFRKSHEPVSLGFAITHDNDCSCDWPVLAERSCHCSFVGAVR
jgi:hypothetical protein